MKKADALRYGHLFSTEQIREQLKQKVVSGSLYTITAEFISFALRMVSTIVLSRILLPEHFGLIAMVTALTSVGERFKDLGLSTAIVQRNVITHEEVSTLFWINLGMGAVFTIIGMALSPAMAYFYSDRRLTGIALALSLSFVFGGLTVQHQALLRRQLHFGRLAGIQILSNGLSISVGIILALNGFGYWALVWKEVLWSILTAAGSLAMCPWCPGNPKWSKDLFSILRFGRDISGFNIAYFFSRSLDQILLGRFWGAGPLGLYKQAYQLMLAPVSQLQWPVEHVAEPALSALQNEHEKYRQTYMKIISFLSFATMPLVVYLGMFSETLVRTLLGDKWIGSASILRILAIAAFIQPVASTCGFVMVTNGKSRRYFLWGLLNAICVCAAISLGICWGPLGVAKAYAINVYVTLIPSLWFGFEDTPISISLFFKAISLPSLASVLMGVVLLLISPEIVWMPSLSQTLISFSLAITLYFIIMTLIPAGRRMLKEYRKYIVDSVKINL